MYQLVRKLASRIRAGVRYASCVSCVRCGTLWTEVRLSPVCTVAVPCILLWLLFLLLFFVVTGAVWFKKKKKKRIFFPFAFSRPF